MTSWQMRALAAYTRIWRRPRTYGNPAAVAAMLARPKAAPDPPAQLTERYRISRADTRGFPVYTVTGAETRPPSGGTIYVHGGGYINEIQSVHWKLIGDIADATRRPVHVPIYGLAPQHHAAEAIDFLQGVLAATTDSGAPVYLAGDSSGGGLALAATQTWIGAGGAAPVGLTLISPWLDIALTNPGIAAVQGRDPWLSAPGLRECGKVWAAGIPLDDPRVSPIRGNLADLPPIDLYIGDRDIFLPDCRQLRDAVPAGRLTYHEQPGGIHVYPLLPVPEANSVRPGLVARIAAALDGR